MEKDPRFSDVVFDPALGASDYEIKIFIEMLSQFLLPDRFRIREVRVSREYDDSE